REGAAEEAGGQPGPAVTHPGEQGGGRRGPAGSQVGHARHAPNDTLFPDVTGEARLCRSIYVYVLFRTEGRPVTRSPATPLPPPKERRRLREAHALTRAQLAE